MDCTTPERKILCEFSLEKRISDIDLPSQIKSTLDSLDLYFDPEKHYILTVYFDAYSRHCKGFYDLPIERTPGRDKQITVHDVLRQQINNIRHALEPLNINFSKANIKGIDLLFDIFRVDIRIEEDNSKRYKNQTACCTNIIPDVEFTVNNFKKAFKEAVKQHKENEQKKVQEKLQNTPNMKSVEEIFLALATAILDESPDKSTSPKKLSCELILQSELKYDWPLEIRGSADNSPTENCMVHKEQINCPEFLIYIKNKSSWTLKKTISLETAKDTILNYGYNQKSVEQVILLHNLKNVRFNLFANNKGEITPISKSEAHTAKKLVLSWC